MTLTEFLLARIAEDEAWGLYRSGDYATRPTAPSTLDGADPSRVLSECHAKRRIVEDFEESDHQLGIHRTPFVEGRRFAALLAVARVAETYADHPDYQREWKP